MPSTTPDSHQNPERPQSLLLNPPAWLIIAVLVLSVIVSPLDWQLRELVGPETRAGSPVITSAGPYHAAIYHPVVFANYVLLPLTLWTLIILGLPLNRRFRGISLVIAGFALRGLFEYLKANGQSWVALLDSSLPMILLLLLLGQFPNGKQMWYAYFIPVALSQVLTHVLKLTVGRYRPKIAESQFQFNPLHPWEGDYSSYPSGHTSAATAMALLMAVYIPQFRWVFFCLALIVASERIVTNAHWLSDVVGGVAIGLAAVWIGRRLFTPEHYRTSVPDSHRLESVEGRK